MKRVLAIVLAAGMLLTATGCRVVYWIRDEMATLRDEKLRREILDTLQTAESFEITASDGTLLMTQTDLQKVEALWYDTGVDGEIEIIPVVQITFRADSIEKFAAATARYRGRELVFLLDGEEVMRAAGNESITDSVIILSGGDIDTYAKALELAARIESTMRWY